MRHNESILQRNCVAWFNLQYRRYAMLLFAVPNGARTSATQARILKAEGMTAGVADLILMVPRKGYHALCLEMKTLTGRQQPTQKAWQEAVEEQGYKYVIVRTFADFQKSIKGYLDDE